MNRKEKKINTKGTKGAQSPQRLISYLCDLCVHPLCSLCFSLIHSRFYGSRLIILRGTRSATSSLQIPLVAAVALVPAHTDGFHVAAAGEVGFVDLHDFDVLEAELAEAFAQLGVEHGVAAQSLVVGVQPDAVDVHPLRTAPVAQQVVPAEGPQPPAGFLQTSGEIVVGEDEADHLLVFQEQLDQAWICDVDQGVDDAVHLGLRRRVEGVCVGKGCAVHGNHARRPLFHLCFAGEGFDGVAAALFDALGDLEQPLRQGMVAGEVAGEVVGVFFEAGLLDEAVVIGMVVGHAEGGAMLEAFDQDAAAVGADQPARADDAVQAAAARPGEGGFEEGGGGLAVFDDFEEAEEGGFGLAVGVVVAVLHDGEATERLPFAFDEEEGGSGVLVKGVLAGVEQGARFGEQRRHPLRAAAVEAEGEEGEAIDLLFVVRGDFDEVHAASKGYLEKEISRRAAESAE